ncbi:MAG: ABC transporter substrate-binding protein [Candidatus Cloacimonetes bacterium]|nr:ABC transporter substrate-binding protein [Candidatus Cloacimonadota bacterium]
MVQVSFIVERSVKIFCLILFIFTLVTLFACQKQQVLSSQPRYIVTSPEIAEIIAAVAGTENIVGVTTECNYPPELQAITKVGTFGNVSIEKILKMNPTLVFTSGLEQELVSTDLGKLNLQVVSLYPQSVQELLDTVRKIGLLTDNSVKADAIADSLEIALNTIRNNISSDQPRVYVEIYGSPLMSVANNSFVGELIELAGGDNIFSELPRNYSRIKPEEIINRDPEIILITYPGISREDIINRKGWSDISACLDQRIYTIDDIDPDLILRASVRVTEGLQRLREIFDER